MKGLSFVKKLENLVDGTHDQGSTPSPKKESSGGGFTSKFDGFGRGLASKMNSISNALGVEEEESAHKAFDKQLEKFREVEILVENFRLQCPQTHIGLVVAFTTTTLSPLVNPNIKFKWYRVEADIVQIDESARGWYPPTADDIGKKIMAQCQDEFDQGYCRYAEAGPVEADPLLCTMVESSLENGRYECKDVEVSFGAKEKDISETVLSASAAAGGDGVAACQFNMLSRDRPTSLSPNGPFLKVPQHMSIEVTYQGVFINGGNVGADEMDVSSSHRGRRGLQIHPSSQLKVHCTLPASVVIVVPLNPAAPPPYSTPQKSAASLSGDTGGDVVSGEANGTIEASENMKNDSPAKEASPEGAQRPKSTDSEAGATASATVGELLSHTPYQWIGSQSGEVNELVMEFIKSLPPDATSFSICFACVDRMTRDTLALSCRALVGFDSNVGARERLSSLPWFSDDGIRRTADVQSIAGKDLVMRLKDLEDENATLKRQQYALNLQIMEHEEESASHAALDSFRNSRLRSSSSVGSGIGHDEAEMSEEHCKDRGADDTKGVDESCAAGSQQQQHQINQLKAKIRENDQIIATAKHKEIESEKQILEIMGKLKRLQSDIEKEKTAASELKQKVTEAHAGEGSMRILMEQSQNEVENLQSKYDAETLELKKTIDMLSADLADKAETAETEARNALKMHIMLDEKMKEIEQLRDRIAELESGSAETNAERHSLEKNLAQKVADHAAAVDKGSALEARVSELEAEVAQLKEVLDKTQGDLEVLQALQNESQNSSVSRQVYEELESEHITCEGEKNHWQKTAQSLAKETKRIMKEKQTEIRGLEADLDRKDTLCARLREQIDMMTRKQEEDERKRQEEEAHKSKGLFHMGRKKTTEDTSNK